MENSHQTETYKSLIQISHEGFRYLAITEWCDMAHGAGFCKSRDVVDAVRTNGIKLVMAIQFVSAGLNILLNDHELQR